MLVSMREFSDEEIEDFEAQLEDTDVTALLLQQNAYLDAILRELRGVEEPQEESMYQCTKCNQTVSEGNREAHMEQEHNAPAGVSTANSFEQQ